MSPIIEQLTDPAVLEAEADLAAVLPYPGPVVAIALRLAASWIRAGKTAEEINAILAQTSQAAQELADHWSEPTRPDVPRP